MTLDDMISDVNWANEPDYSGNFTRDTAEGAIPSGERVIKINGEPGDMNPIGARGTILGSLGPIPPLPQFFNSEHFYFVEWDSTPKTAVGILSWKIKRDHLDA